ncbi:glutamine-hydrolyzing GMP synthase, partial [bacterium]|nr:glutamine-hydrolyzing GMP synthase [bacterium]
MTHTERIAILDFGSQTTQLIARRLRELGIYCEILPFSTETEAVLTRETRGIIFSGGPSSVLSKDAPKPDSALYESGLPMLGICYGMQLMGQYFGSPVVPGAQGEFGPARISLDKSSGFWQHLGSAMDVWMSHGDHLESVAEPLRLIASSESEIVSAVAHNKLPVYGVQFHPEVTHTVRGAELLKNFAYEICGCTGGWSMESFIDSAVKDIRHTVGDKPVLCALSGGLDSSVTAKLLAKAIPGQVVCIHVDTGLNRKHERQQVEEMFKREGTVELDVVDAGAEFYGALAGVTDPEQKRKIVGREFIEVFQREAAKLKDVKFLAQGTLYPDVIESVSVRGPSATIKSHHNVGGLPESLHMTLIEPLRELF